MSRADHVVIDIEDCPRQLFTRFYVRGVTVLVDATPLGDEDVEAVHRLIENLAEPVSAGVVHARAVMRVNGPSELRASASRLANMPGEYAADFRAEAARLLEGNPG